MLTRFIVSFVLHVPRRRVFTVRVYNEGLNAVVFRACCGDFERGGDRGLRPLTEGSTPSKRSRCKW